MDDDDGDLPPQQARALAELLTARSLEEAAQRVGISERTLRRWLERGDFRQALRSQQRALMQHITTRLEQASVRAVDTLVSVMDDGAASASARISAARAVLDLAREGVDLDRITERLEALEAASEFSSVHSGGLV